VASRALRTTRRYIPDDGTVYNHLSEVLKSDEEIDRAPQECTGCLVLASEALLLLLLLLLFVSLFMLTL
jgi:hypothetical protein